MQEFKYKLVGDTKPAIAANEALDASIKQVDSSTKQLDANLAKSGEALELSLQKQEAKIKALGGAINILGGSVELVVGSLGLIGVDEKTVGEFQKAAVSAIAFADGAKRVFEGYKEITEAKKIFSAITKAETVAETANTVATAANTTATVAGTTATNAANTATKAFNATLLKNPYVIAAAAVAALVAGVYALVKANEAEKKSIEELTEEYDKYNEINQRRATNRERELELDVEKTRLQQGEIAAAEKALQLAKDKLEQDEIDLIVFQSKQDEVESTLSRLDEEIAKKEKLVELAFREGFEQTRLGQNAEQYRDELNELYTEREKFLQREVDINQNIKKSQNEVLAAERALEKVREDARKKREDDARKAKEKADKANEKLAIQAAKQLKDESEALNNLIELTEELALLDGSLFKSRQSGQFEFNTELDRTNFQLQEQLNILYSLNQAYEDLGDQLEEVTEGASESFFSAEQLEVFKKLRDANKTELQLQLEGLRTTYLEDLTLFSDNEEMKSKITEQYEEDRAELRRQYAIQTGRELLSITSNFLNTIADINQANLQLQLAQAGNNQAAIDRINQDALEKQKKLRVAQVIITTAESILNGFNTTSTLPVPFNFIAGGALALAYGALGVKTIQTINATTLQGGSSAGGFNNIPGGGFSLPGGGGVQIPTSQGAILPGLGGGRVGRAPGTGATIDLAPEPIRAYVLAGDVTNGVQANVALNTRRRLSSG
jgi:hypothetical protein